ncbi:MAG: hypothetical protein KDD48_01880 [Bdellovibrionales bacterium]|nr:hypothetical protein [Bdellovibrionales bacterium]
MKNRLGLILVLISTSAFSNSRAKTRVDFSDMQIRGQTKNADTVYMYDRGQLDQKSQIKVREDYRKEIMEKPLL